MRLWIVLYLLFPLGFIHAAKPLTPSKKIQDKISRIIILKKLSEYKLHTYEGLPRFFKERPLGCICPTHDEFKCFDGSLTEPHVLESEKKFKDWAKKYPCHPQMGCGMGTNTIWVECVKNPVDQTI